MWLRARQADTVATILAELGIDDAPEIVEADTLGTGAAPRTRLLLLLRADAGLPATAELGDAVRVGVKLVAGAAPADALAARADFVLVPTWERARDEERWGGEPGAAGARGVPVAGLPPCLAPEREPLPAESDVIDLITLSAPDKIDVVGFTHHFLRDLDRVKSTRCVFCSHDAACSGGHVNQARRLGFSRLLPVVPG